MACFAGQVLERVLCSRTIGVVSCHMAEFENRFENWISRIWSYFSSAGRDGHRTGTLNSSLFR